MEKKMIPIEYDQINVGDIYYGYIGRIIEKGVFVHFLGNLKAFLSNAELENSFEKQQICWTGKSLRVAITRINREDQNIYLTSKVNKIYPLSGPHKEGKKSFREVLLDLKDSITNFHEETKFIENCEAAKSGLVDAWKDIHFGDYIKGTVQMIKVIIILIK